MGTVDKLTELQYRRSVIEQGGGAAEIKKQHDAGKLTARERISALFDEGSFVELDAFVNHKCVEFGMDAKETPGEGVVTGYGTVDGRLVYAYSQDYTVMAGSLGSMHSKKICKVLDMAAKMGAPVIALLDSGGARIHEGVDALAALGEVLTKTALNSGVVPQIAVVLGTCAGGAAQIAGLSDFVFMVDDISKVFMFGPQVVSAKEGKTISDMELGGAKVHSENSGVCNFEASSETEALGMVKALLSYLPSNNLEETPFSLPSDDINRVSESLQTIVPDDSNAAFDVRGVIAQIADNGGFLEVSKNFAKNIVAGFAKMNGQAVGIVANNTIENDGLLDINACDKASKFVSFCDCFNLPIVTLTDVGGFVVSSEQEHLGLLKHSSKLLYAYTEATVPKVNVIIRKAYGSSYITMCSKHTGADIVLAWPTAEISVMAPEGAANIIFKNEIAESSNPVATRNEKITEYKNKCASPFEAAMRGYADDVIEPDSTRPRIIAALEMLASKREARPAKKHGNLLG